MRTLQTVTPADLELVSTVTLVKALMDRSDLFFLTLTPAASPIPDEARLFAQGTPDDLAALLASSFREIRDSPGSDHFGLNTP